MGYFVCSRRAAEKGPLGFIASFRMISLSGRARPQSPHRCWLLANPKWARVHPKLEYTNACKPYDSGPQRICRCVETQTILVENPFIEISLGKSGMRLGAHDPPFALGWCGERWFGEAKRMGHPAKHRGARTLLKHRLSERST
jgi:hypothetical protein